MMYKEIKCEEKVQNTINSISPYIGKMRIELVKYLIEHYAEKGGTIYDPFAGSGTVLLEGWAMGHSVIGNDLNYYAYILALGKLNPYQTLEEAERSLYKYKKRAEQRALKIDTEDISDWVKSFYDENTLKEICSWVYYLKREKEWFLLSCLMGILHHQRPGFLSYPASHGVPYLRNEKFPIDIYPEMYQYKNVYEKLLAKVRRSFKAVPKLDFSISRQMLYGDATKIKLENGRIPTIITSPPYMKSLTYARDNRLRLWFLGVEDWISLDKIISPERTSFFEMMKKCFEKWSSIQSGGDKCIVVIGEMVVSYNGEKCSMLDALVDIAKKYYFLVEAYYDPIPEKKKVVKGTKNIKRECILVFERR